MALLGARLIKRVTFDSLEIDIRGHPIPVCPHGSIDGERDLPVFD
jgi:hypothetical protein